MHVCNNVRFHRTRTYYIGRYILYSIDEELVVYILQSPGDSVEMHNIVPILYIYTCGAVYPIPTTTTVSMKTVLEKYNIMR